MTKGRIVQVIMFIVSVGLGIVDITNSVVNGPLHMYLPEHVIEIIMGSTAALSAFLPQLKAIANIFTAGDNNASS